MGKDAYKIPRRPMTWSEAAAAVLLAAELARANIPGAFDNGEAAHSGPLGNVRDSETKPPSERPQL